MIAYASHTGTKRNLQGIRENDWRILYSAAEPSHFVDEGILHALDNGAWQKFQQGREWDADADKAFGFGLDRWGKSADWVVAPDIVAGGMRSLALSLSWMPRVLSATSYALLAVQDGMTVEDVRPHVGGRVGIFVGGSTDKQRDEYGRVWNWKEKTIPDWCGLGREVGCWVHVGRVNTARRIAICGSFGADSFDGTSASKYAVTIPPLTRARNQFGLFNRKVA